MAAERKNVRKIFERGTNTEANEAFVPMKYKVVKRLGAGTSGVVHLIENDQKELFVKKTMDMSDRTANQIMRAMAEVSVLASLDHPNIVHHRESYVDGNNLEIIMEYIDDGDLEHKIEKQRKVQMYFSEKSILSVFAQICLGLKHCHDRKVIHRDLKPDNVFISTSGVVKIGDFGFTTVLNTTNAKAQTMLGTPFYMAPELCRGEAYDAKVDMWALGCILYRLCSLRQAFPANDMPTLVHKIQNSPTPKLPKHFSEKVQRLVSRLLEKDVASRPTINALFEEDDTLRHHGKALLGDTAYEEEFSHTVLHDFSLDQDVEGNESEQAYNVLLEKYGQASLKDGAKKEEKKSDKKEEGGEDIQSRLKKLKEKKGKH